MVDAETGLTSADHIGIEMMEDFAKPYAVSQANPIIMFIKY